jgi:dipeptidyl aminopeptidase/acylaminoacyl peptidase
MIMNPRRWWLVRALGRSRVVRAVDRVEAFAVVASLAMVVSAALYCATLADSFYASRSHTVAVEAATRHLVDATAVAASTADPKTVQQAVQRYTVHVRWLAQNVTREKDLRLDHAVKAGDHVPVWLDDRGNATTPPLTDVGAHGDAVGAAALLWVLVTSVIGGAVVLLRRLLNGVRYRSWDRALQWLLVDNGGGPSAHSR